MWNFFIPFKKKFENLHLIKKCPNTEWGCKKESIMWNWIEGLLHKSKSNQSDYSHFHFMAWTQFNKTFYIGKLIPLLFVLHYIFTSLLRKGCNEFNRLDYCFRMSQYFAECKSIYNSAFRQIVWQVWVTLKFYSGIQKLH